MRNQLNERNVDCYGFDAVSHDEEAELAIVSSARFLENFASLGTLPKKTRDRLCVSLVRKYASVEHQLIALFVIVGMCATAIVGCAWNMLGPRAGILGLAVYSLLFAFSLPLAWRIAAAKALIVHYYHNERPTSASESIAAPVDATNADNG